MKIIFPQVEETLLLHILTNAENNVQKASEELILLGYTKREISPPPPIVQDNRKIDGNSATDNNLLESAKNSASMQDKLSSTTRNKDHTEEEKLQSIFIAN